MLLYSELEGSPTRSRGKSPISSGAPRPREHPNRIYSHLGPLRNLWANGSSCKTRHMSLSCATKSSTCVVLHNRNREGGMEKGLGMKENGNLDIFETRIVHSIHMERLPNTSVYHLHQCQFHDCKLKRQRHGGCSINDYLLISK